MPMDQSSFVSHGLLFSILQEIFENHKIVFTVSTSIASVATAWAGNFSPFLFLKRFYVAVSIFLAIFWAMNGCVGIKLRIRIRKI